MKKSSMFPLLVVCFMWLCLFGCGGKAKVTTLNSVSSFYSGGTRFEATARELTIDGNEAQVRIRFTNMGDEAVDGVYANVEFLDQQGAVLYTTGLNISSEAPLVVGDSVSGTTSCSGKNVSKIRDIHVNAQDG